MTPVEVGRVALALGFFGLSTVGVGTACMIRIGAPRSALELATLSVAVTGTLVYGIELARHWLELPPWTGPAALGAFAIVGLLQCRRALAGLAGRADAREAVYALGALACALLGLMATIHTFGGGDWQMDWLGHYQRAMFWQGSSDEIALGFGDVIPSRPPLGNLLASTFLTVAGPSFVAYQVAMSALAACLVFPIGWALEELGVTRHAATRAAALLLIHPVFVQNASYPWTKLVAAFYAIAGLLVAWRWLRGGGSPGAASISVALLAAATVSHYSSLPYLLLVGGAVIVYAARRRQLSTIAAALTAVAVVVGPWVLLSCAEFGVADTFAPFTETVPSVARAQRAAGDVVATLIPHPMRGVELDRIEQSSRLGYVRDYAFLIYQSCAPLGAGVAGLLALVVAARQSTWGERASWGGLALFVLAAIAWSHPWPAPFGLSHIALTPLVLLFGALVARLWSRSPRLQTALMVLAVLDLGLGVWLHFGLQSLTIESDGSGVAATLTETIRSTRQLALDSGVRTLGQRLGGLRGLGFAVYGVTLVAVLRRALAR